MHSLGAVAVLVAAASLETNGFGWAPNNVRPMMTATSRSSLSSTVLPVEDLTRPQPELDEDDLYLDGAIDPPKVGALMKMIPAESFDIDTPTSLLYFFIDLLAVVASMGFLNAVVTSDAYHALPFYLQALEVMPLQILTGFAMWCMWCIGHDAGHTTVSNEKWINRLVGEVAHSVICLTPFLPWAHSHRRHHVHHNHKDRDYSHQWYVREEKDDLDPVYQVAHKLRLLQLPFNYLIYLLIGIPDGGHVIFYGRMWEGVSMKQKLDSAISVAVSVATAGTLWMNMGTADFTVVCMVPWLVLSWWLFMVTYLQHHSEDGQVFTDDTYTFERGAFQTVDRSYGKILDNMSHHMMSGHLIHHLFFTKVPHYRLEAATKALRKNLDEAGQGELYKFIDTPKYNRELLKQWRENWFFVNESQVVRE